MEMVGIRGLWPVSVHRMMTARARADVRIWTESGQTPILPEVSK